MFSTNQIIELIRAHKTGNEAVFNEAIQDLIRLSDVKGKKGVAKSLREVYSKPNDLYKRVKPLSFKTNTEASVGTSPAHVPGVRLNDVVLSNRNTTNVIEILETWTNKSKLKNAGISHGVKLLLHGQPGTGKTYLANAIAGTLNMPLTYVDVSKLISSFLGETGKNIQALFEGKQGQVLFLDEFESIAKNRADEMDVGEAKRIVTAILQGLDSISDDVLVIAATNHIEMIDSAISRRFTHELDLNSLDLIARKKLFSMYLKSTGVPEKLISGYADISDEFTGFDIQQAYNKAARRSVLKLDSIPLEHQIYRQIVEIKFRKIVFDSKNESAVKELVRIVKILRKLNAKYFTYEILESITGIPSSTIHYLTERKKV